MWRLSGPFEPRYQENNSMGRQVATSGMNFLRAPNKMNLHSSGLFRLWAASDSIDHPRMVCFVLLARSENARSRCNDHFVRGSKLTLVALESIHTPSYSMVIANLRRSLWLGSRSGLVLLPLGPQDIVTVWCQFILTNQILYAQRRI